MPCRNPCRLYIHLAFTYSVGPSNVVWSKLGPAPPCPPMRVLGVSWSRALVSCVKWPWVQSHWVTAGTISSIDVCQPDIEHVCIKILLSANSLSSFKSPFALEHKYHTHTWEPSGRGSHCINYLSRNLYLWRCSTCVWIPICRASVPSAGRSDLCQRIQIAGHSRFLSELIFVDNIYMNETCLRPRDRAPDLRMAVDPIPGSPTLNEFMHLTT
jgi:hypothetical protein